MLLQRVLERGRGLVRRVVRAAERLGDHFVHHAQFLQAAGVELEGGGGLGGMGAVLPQDGGAAFGGDDRVISVLENEHAVGDADAEGAAGAALADDDGDGGDLEQGHLAKIDGNGLGDVAGLGLDAGVGAGGVDEGKDGQAELLGEFHQAEGLAVALGLGHAEIADDVLLGVPTLLLGNDHDGAALEEGGATDQCPVVVKLAVAVELLKVGAEGADVVEGVGALGVAGDLHALPRGEVGVDVPLGDLDLFLDGGQLAGHVDVVLKGLLVQGFELLLEFAEWFLELEQVGGSIHGVRG